MRNVPLLREEAKMIEIPAERECDSVEKGSDCE